MSSLVIKDLIAEGDFCEPLTAESAQNILGSGTGAGSVSAGRYYEKNGVSDATALTATVASSSRRPFAISLSYSFEPRLSVSARVSAF